MRGRSPVALLTTAPEVDGILPVISILRIRDLSSSSSSQTEAAGPVESSDSVPSRCDTLLSKEVFRGVTGLVIFEGLSRDDVYCRFDGRYAAVRVVEGWAAPPG